MKNDIDSILEKLQTLPEQERERIVQEAYSVTNSKRWIPNPGPQTEAYFSKADTLLYGGSPGSGKSQLVLGLAYNEHQRSLIMRRQYTDLVRLTDDLIKIHGSKSGFKGSPPPMLRVNDSKIIEFGAAQRVGDEQSKMGQGRDFLGIDEATHFAEIQIRFLMGWNRTDDPTQRVRTVFATNPPLTSEGLWVTKMFAPWLDSAFPHKAKEGELRWAITNALGHDEWVDGPDPVEVKGKLVYPKSRTYIPGKLRDNPYLMNTSYERELDALPEPFRSLLLGGFQTQLRDSLNQVIPTEWIKQAICRWEEKPPHGVPLCSMGVDIAQGGDDNSTIAMRYGWWYDKIISVPGIKTPTGKEVAGMIITHRRGDPVIVLDMGGGYGGATFEHLRENGLETIPYKGADGSTAKTKDGVLRFYNKRAEVYWRFREALDPSQPGGSKVALPDDQELLADLAAPTLDMGFNGIKLITKEKLIDLIGRSPDKGDAVVIAWAYGEKFEDNAKMWTKGNKKQQPSVIMKRRK